MHHSAKLRNSVVLNMLRQNEYQNKSFSIKNYSSKHLISCSRVTRQTEWNIPSVPLHLHIPQMKGKQPFHLFTSQILGTS